VDNIFPHHEDERAQSEGYTGQPFVNYWVHAQHLLVDGLKMAKSAGNDYTLNDLIARGFEPAALRYLFAMVHYRHRLNFTFAALRAAQTGLRRLRAAARALYRASTPAARAALTADPATVPLGPSARAYLDAIEAAFADDLHLPRALAQAWRLVRRSDPTIPPAERLAVLLRFDRVLGLDLARELVEPAASDSLQTVPPEIATLVAQRAHARAQGDYAQADALRAQLAAAGYHIRDTHEGPVVVPADPRAGLAVISSSRDVPSQLVEPDRYTFTVIWNVRCRRSRARSATIASKWSSVTWIRRMRPRPTCARWPARATWSLMGGSYRFASTSPTTISVRPPGAM
jgi:cysteinyl-tRNA synthetase